METEHLILRPAEPIRAGEWLSFYILFPDGEEDSEDNAVIYVGFIDVRVNPLGEYNDFIITLKSDYFTQIDPAQQLSSVDHQHWKSLTSSLLLLVELDSNLAAALDCRGRIIAPDLDVNILSDYWGPTREFLTFRMNPING